MNNLTHRRLQISLAFLSFFVLFFSFYFEYAKGLLPCPLCLMQRLCVALLFLLSLLSVYAKTIRWSKSLTLLQLFFAAAGLFFAGRQLWLQALPVGQTPACMPGLDILIRYFPWRDVLHAIIWGAGDCAEVSWQWLDLSMPAWAALYFSLVFITIFFVYLNANKFFSSR